MLINSSNHIVWVYNKIMNTHGVFVVPSTILLLLVFLASDQAKIQFPVKKFGLVIKWWYGHHVGATTVLVWHCLHV